MKRKGNLYNNICDISNIYNVYKDLRKSVNNKKEVLDFKVNLHSNICNLSKELYNKKYIVERYNIFLIREPKYRLIMSERFKDKLINHLVSRYILDVLDNSLISTNVATRKGKGGSYAFDKLIKYINELRKLEKKIYVLKIDISKYFYNIDHDILKDKLRRKIKDSDALDIIYKIIDSTNCDYVNERIENVKSLEIDRVRLRNNRCCDCDYLISEIRGIPCYKFGKGLSIGNMTSQILAIFYLSDIDHYIKEVLRYKYYIRYMDDLVILDCDKKRLIRDFEVIRCLLEKEKLCINSKSKIYCLDSGFSFLGYKFCLCNGKLLIRYNNSTIKRIRKSLRGKKKNNYSLYYKSIRSYKGYFSKSNSNLKKDLMVVERSMYDKYSNLKKDYKKFLIFVKSGMFYYTYDEDSLIMNYIFDYKIINGKVGFPVKNMEYKIKRKLETFGISYVVLDGNEVSSFALDGDGYVRYLGEAYDKYEKDKCFERIIGYVNRYLSKSNDNYFKLESMLIDMVNN